MSTLGWSHVLAPAIQPPVGAATSTATDPMVNEVGTLPASANVTPNLVDGTIGRSDVLITYRNMNTLFSFL